MNQAGPRALLEHLDRAESLATNGDARGAVSFYQAALTEARSLQGLDSGTIDRIRLGQAYVRQRAADFGRALDACAVDGPDDSLRLRHAIDMVKGQREIFPQRPSMFYFPYLPQRQFGVAGYASETRRANGKKAGWSSSTTASSMKPGIRQTRSGSS